MKTTLLNVLFRDKNELPPLMINFYEDSLVNEPSSGQDDSNGDGWSSAILKVWGKGMMMRYTHAQILEPMTFYSIPLEPVVVLHIQVNNEAYMGYQGEEKTLWPMDQCNIFWQGKNVLETHVLPGMHTQFDLYFRPNIFKELAEGPILTKLLEELTSTPRSATDFFQIQADDELENAFFHFCKSVWPEKPGINRFHFLSKQFLLKCVGIDVAEPENLDPSPDPKEQTGGPAEETETPDASLDELLPEYDTWKNAIESLKNSIETDRAKWDKTYQLYMQYMGPVLAHSAEIFMNLARLFADEVSKGSARGLDQKTFRNAIRIACDRAFEIRPPSPEEMAFQGQWVKDAKVQVYPFDLKDITGFMGNLFSDEFGKEMDFGTGEDTPEGRALFEEKLRENLGFRHLDEFEPQIKKPAEISELYAYLVQQLHDNLTLDQEGGIARNDLFRLLDHAYHHEDLNALLLLEIQYLASDPVYLERQDSKKIASYIKALQTQEAALRTVHERLPETGKYASIARYADLIDQEKLMKSSLRQEAAGTLDLMNQLDHLYQQICEKYSSFKIYALAKSLIRLDDEEQTSDESYAEKDAPFDPQMAEAGLSKWRKIISKLFEQEMSDNIIRKEHSPIFRRYGQETTDSLEERDWVKSMNIPQALVAHIVKNAASLTDPHHLLPETFRESMDILKALRDRDDVPVPLKSYLLTWCEKMVKQLEIDEWYKDHLDNFVVLLMGKAGRYEEALQLVDEEIQRHQKELRRYDYAQAIFLKQELLVGNGRYEESKKLLQDNLQNFEIRRFCVDEALFNGDYPSAILLIQAGIKDLGTPQSKQDWGEWRAWHSMLIDAYESNGNRKEAVAVAEKVFTYPPSVSNAAHYLKRITHVIEWKPYLDWLLAIRPEGKAYLKSTIEILIEEEEWKHIQLVLQNAPIKVLRYYEKELTPQLAGWLLEQYTERLTREFTKNPSIRSVKEAKRKLKILNGLANGEERATELFAKFFQHLQGR